MTFSKIRMGEEELFETIVYDQYGTRLERWKCMKKDFPKVVKILTNKFGLKMVIKDKKEDLDLDWAK